MLVLVLEGTARHADAVTASTATDVCAAAADPCNVATVVNVTNGATLDFGTRALALSGSGQFNFGAGSGTILCGPFSAITTGDAIKASALDGATTRGGLVTIEARRACSIAARPCLATEQCQLGTCGVRRCSLRPGRTCTSGSNCQLGTCLANRRCSLSPASRCNVNADCNLGTCPAQLTCSQLAGPAVNCASNTDCDFGTCSVGQASIDVNGTISGNASDPAVVVLHAADAVKLRKQVNLSGSSATASGGELAVRAEAGDIGVSGKLLLSGGADGVGGDVTLTAGNDLDISADVDVTGGDFDGGITDLQAGRDVTLGKSINASSIAGAGLGGAILVQAGRDLAVSGVSDVAKSRLSADGHADGAGVTGDGGVLQLIAARHLSLNANTVYEANGAAPDAFGGDMLLDAGGNLALAGEIVASSTGAEGAGGFVRMLADGSVQIAAAGSVDLLGGHAGGGIVRIFSAGNVDFAGTADVGGNGGAGGSVFVDSSATVTLSGTMSTAGSAAPDDKGKVDIAACHIQLTASGMIDNDTVAGRNRLQSRESMTLLAGSSLFSSGDGNLLVYRSGSAVPVIAGSVAPAPQLVEDAALTACAVCGDALVEEPETCDDGNTVFVKGEYCGATCLLVPCGHPSGVAGPKPSASDALFTLKTAVHSASCDLRVCDVDSSQKVTANDALRILRAAVGLPLDLVCPT